MSSNASLSDLPNLTVAVQTWPASDRQPTSGFVSLGYDEAAFRAAHNGDCATVDISGSLDGHALEADGGSNSDEGDECYAPSFTLNGDFSGTQTFEIHGGSTTITAVFAPDALAPHMPVLISPAQWKLSAGEAVQVRWSAPDDLLAQLPAQPAPVWFSTGKIENNNAFDLTATFSGDQISWTMPSPLPRTGDGFIVFSFGYSTGAATTCTGATRCTYSADRGYMHSVTLAP